MQTSILSILLEYASSSISVIGKLIGGDIFPLSFNTANILDDVCMGKITEKVSISPAGSAQGIVQVYIFVAPNNSGSL